MNKKNDFRKGIVDEQKIYNSIYTFYIEPLKAKLRSFPIHIVLNLDDYENRFFGEVRNALIEIVENKLTFTPMVMGFLAMTMNMPMALYSFDCIIEVVKQFIIENIWPISDLLHILKNIKVYSLLKIIRLSLLPKYDVNELENFLEYQHCLNDKSSEGSMKRFISLFPFWVLIFYEIYWGW